MPKPTNLVGQKVYEMVRHWRDTHSKDLLENDVKELLNGLVKTFKNKFESGLHGQLKRAGANFGYEIERIPYTISGNYIPDFTITLPSGKKRYIEGKGYFRPESKRKMVAVKRQHPQLDIRIIFYSARKRDIKWAEKYGFPYAIGKIPKEWLD